MMKSFLANVLLWLISVSVLATVGCKMCLRNKKTTDTTITEMPRPISTHNIDSLKNIQQQKRDSLNRK